MSAVAKQVTLRRRANRGRQAGAEFLLQEANRLAHALQREAAPAKLADHRHRDQFVPVVDPAMALAHRRHDAALVPPLQLPGGDSCKGDHLIGCELLLHLEHAMFQTIKWTNV